jgi:hypothetical protein
MMATSSSDEMSYAAWASCADAKMTTRTTTNADLSTPHNHCFLKEQDDEKSKKKNAFRQVPPDSTSYGTILQEDQREDALLWN